ncbi:DUF2332 domain-containing protein [Bacillus sp. H-16]|uniref:DUF2332 domain-containing protein n=1 Tax=Alteribacter salitolerans TaxID=2912333 RepID=UPI0019660B57|nr:DUF2332 domain-containing protein [Alteribacter salitolerans]MBM7097601.1 DUF2332 domain-containing protein [Alteribacter salitolerans]
MNLSGRFVRFAEKECKGSSQLYEKWSKEVSKDRQLLDLASNAGEGQPVPNLFFGAVQYLLLKEKEDGILGADFKRFKEFCIANKSEISRLLKTKRVQTNEIRRCAYLYPVFCSIFQQTAKPLSLIEIGTSAGLQLHWDRYSYEYGDGYTYGMADSSVRIRSECKGKPVLLPESPPVASRVGVDLYVNDVRKEEDRMWLKALIWPEHEERRVMFEEAARLMKKDPVQLIEGDGVSLLPELAEKAGRDSTLVVFHTHVANQIPVNVKEQLEKNIHLIGGWRDIFHVYNNMWDGLLHVDSIIDGIEKKNTIGRTEGHGQWFEWNL